VIRMEPANGMVLVEMGDQLFRSDETWIHPEAPGRSVQDELGHAADQGDARQLRRGAVLERADVRGGTGGARVAALVGGRKGKRVGGVYGGAAGQQRDRRGRPAVVAQGSEEAGWCCLDWCGWSGNRWRRN